MTDDTPPHPVHFQLCIQPSSNMKVHAAAKISQYYFSDACQILKQVYERLNNSSIYFRLLQNVVAYKSLFNIFTIPFIGGLYLFVIEQILPI